MVLEEAFCSWVNGSSVFIVFVDSLKVESGEVCVSEADGDAEGVEIAGFEWVDPSVITGFDGVDYIGAAICLAAIGGDVIFDEASWDPSFGF